MPTRIRVPTEMDLSLLALVFAAWLGAFAVVWVLLYAEGERRAAPAREPT